MNDFTFHSASDGWIESNVPSYVDALMAQRCANELEIAPILRMLTWAHDKHSPPDFPYTRAFSAHSADLANWQQLIYYSRGESCRTTGAGSAVMMLRACGTSL